MDLHVDWRSEFLLNPKSHSRSVALGRSPCSIWLSSCVADSDGFGWQSCSFWEGFGLETRAQAECCDLSPSGWFGHLQADAVKATSVAAKGSSLRIGLTDAVHSTTVP